MKKREYYVDSNMSLRSDLSQPTISFPVGSGPAVSVTVGQYIGPESLGQYIGPENRSPASLDEGRLMSETEPAAVPLVLRIFAMSQDTIDKVVERIEDFCRTETKVILLDAPAHQEHIRKLSEEQVLYMYWIY